MDERDGYREQVVDGLVWGHTLGVIGFVLLMVAAAVGIVNTPPTDTGRHVGPAVVEQYDTSWVTSDPTADYLIDVGEPLPPAAPGADQ